MRSLPFKLLVTGRKQVLSYFIPPKIDHYRAIAAAMQAAAGTVQ